MSIVEPNIAGAVAALTLEQRLDEYEEAAVLLAGRLSRWKFEDEADIPRMESRLNYLLAAMAQRHNERQSARDLAERQHAMEVEAVCSGCGAKIIDGRCDLCAG